MSSALERRAAQVTAKGYSRRASNDVTVDTTVGGTTITASLATRAKIAVYLHTDAGAPVFISVGGTPTTSSYDVAISPGQQWSELVDAAITIKGIVASGSESVHVYELGAPV